MDFNRYFKGHDYQAVVLGGSAGSIRVVCDILKQLRPDFRLPLMLALHRGPQKDSALAKVLEPHTTIPIIEPKGRVLIEKNHIYLAPADKHLIVEPDFHLNVEQSALVQYSRPSIDVLLLSAADAYQDTLIGIIVTGANRDGTMGMKMIKAAGGHTIVQDPQEATINVMPKSVMEITTVDHVLKVKQIAELLNSL